MNEPDILIQPTGPESFDVIDGHLNLMLLIYFGVGTALAVDINSGQTIEVELLPPPEDTLWH